MLNKVRKGIVNCFYSSIREGAYYPDGEFMIVMLNLKAGEDPSGFRLLLRVNSDRARTPAPCHYRQWLIQMNIKNL